MNFYSSTCTIPNQTTFKEVATKQQAQPNEQQIREEGSELGISPPSHGVSSGLQNHTSLSSAQQKHE
jgi:hypothetical protein